MIRIAEIGREDERRVILSDDEREKPACAGFYNISEVDPGGLEPPAFCVPRRRSPS